jgi:protein associated with RNAse G/E
MYKLGIEKNCTRVSRFDEALKYYANNDEMTRKVLTAREKFYMWIETQTKKFQQEMM